MPYSVEIEDAKGRTNTRNPLYSGKRAALREAGARNDQRAAGAAYRYVIVFVASRARCEQCGHPTNGARFCCGRCAAAGAAVDADQGGA